LEVNRGKVAPWNLVIMLTVLDAPNLQGREGKREREKKGKEEGEVWLVNWDSGTSRVVVTFDILPTQPGQCTL
jgi:hypothetical protein